MCLHVALLHYSFKAANEKQDRKLAKISTRTRRLYVVFDKISEILTAIITAFPKRKP